MSGRILDFAIVGGGLAGGLLALALRKALPDASLALFEAGESFGGNHRWSWFASDCGVRGDDLLSDLPWKAIGRANTVRFPGYERRLEADYRSLDSRDFDAALRRLLPQEAIRAACPVAGVAADHVVLASGERVAARSVIDCRSVAGTETLRGGWQVFLGQHIRTLRPHGLATPIIMDAAVTQHDAYRFVYSLPLAADEIFVEDTYYADSPVLDAPTLRARIAAYCAERGWQGEVVHEETGVLPVVTGGDVSAFRSAHESAGVALAGARGGFFHPLTSYTVPIAVANALAIAAAARRGLAGPGLADFVAKRARRHWRDTAFYRALGRMLFDAAEPGERWRVFARFYRLPEPLVERFYAARSTPADMLRVLSGRPPLPVTRGLRALLGKGAPLVQGTTR